MNTPDAKRKGMRLTAVALALTLLGGFAVADGFAAPPAEAAPPSTDPTPYFPENSALSPAAPVSAINPCTYILQQKDEKAWPPETADKAFADLNCNSTVISKVQMPQQLIAERKISDLVPNCSPDPIVNIGTSWSDVQYVENATTHSSSTTNGFTAGVTVTNTFSTDFFFTGTSQEISISASTTNTWSFGTDERVAIQTGKWRNGTTDMPIPGYSWAYYGYKDLYQQADLLWRWTPDSKKPSQVMSAVQSVNVHQWVNGGFKNPQDGTGKQNQFGVPILHVVPMTPAEIKNCWDNGVPAGWKPGDPRLNYIPNVSKLSFPIVNEPALRAPAGKMVLDSYPFLYSTYPQGNPVTRNLAVAPTVDVSATGTPAAKIPFVTKPTPAPVQMWGKKSGYPSLTKVDVTQSIVMPPGSEVGFWTGKACTALTATIGGTAIKNRDFEQRVKVFAVSMVGGQVQYDRELGDFIVPNPGKSAGNSADGKISVDLLDPETNLGPEAIAIQAYRPDKVNQDITGLKNVLDGNRDAIVLAEPTIDCAPESEEAGDAYIRSAYVGETKNVTANLAATESKVNEDPYLNLRPNVKPSEGYPCAARPDYIGYSCNGTPTKSDGVVYPHAIGLHSPTTIDWGLTSPTCYAFTFGVAFDDHMAGNASRKPLNIEIYVDGALKKTVRLTPYSDRNPVVQAEQALPYGPHMIQLKITPDNMDNGASHINVIDPSLSCKVQDTKLGVKPTPAKPVAMEFFSVNEMRWSGEIAWHLKAIRDVNPNTGGPIEIGKLTYNAGIGGHALSKLDIDIPRGDCSVFTADVGVMTSGLDGSVVFEVWDGDRRLAQSRVMRSGETAAFIQANISGVKTLTLKITDAGDNIAWDHGAWGNPVIGCGGARAVVTDPGTPTNNPDPGTTPVPTEPETQEISAADVQWAENSFLYRPATRGFNLDTNKQVSIDRVFFKSAIAQVSGSATQPSVVRLRTEGQCTQFSATIGVDDYARAAGGGSLKFELIGDGTTVTTSQVLYSNSPITTIEANISGVRSLELRISDGGDGINWDHAVWGDPTLTCLKGASILTSGAAPSETWVADMYWRAAEASDFAIQRNKNMTQTGRVSIAGNPYDHGIGAHSWSVVRVPVSTSCTTFTADIGIDDTAGNNGSVTFQVWGNSTMLYESPKLTGSMDKVHIEIPLNGAAELALTVTDAGDDHAWDHGSWGNPKVVCLD